MKLQLSLLASAIILAGCANNPLASKSESESLSANSVTASSRPVPSQSASPSSAEAAPLSSAVPCGPATAASSGRSKANAAKSKSKTSAKRKSSDAAKTSSAASSAEPCTTQANSPAAGSPALIEQKMVASEDGKKREVKGINDWTGYIEGVPAPKSKFNVLKIGMGTKEVLDLIGPPTDQHSHVTGKAWIPFYFGSGMHETVFYYKGMGRLRFASNAGFTTSNGLIGIEHDAKERGYPQ